MNLAVKELLKTIYKLCDSLDETGMGLKGQGVDLSLRDCFFVETSQFLMYLSASDGRVKWSEAQYISELFDMPATPDQLTSIIKKNNIYSTKFESEIPLSIRVFVKADNRLIDLGKTPENFACKMIADFWENIGKDFLRCDGDLDGNEVKDLRIYMNMVNSYIDSELRVAKKNAYSSQNTLKGKYELLKKN